MAEGDTDNGMAAAIAFAVNHFLIGEDRSQRRAPVNGGLMLIGQAVLVLIAANGPCSGGGDFVRDGQFRNRTALSLSRLPIGTGPDEIGIVPGIEDLQKNPLRPAIVVGIGGGEFTAPVVTEAQHFQLAAEVIDVLVGFDCGVGSRLDGELFSGQSEGIPAHRMQNLLAQHAGVAADDVGCRVAFGVADMQPLAGRVGKHIENVKFWLIRGGLRCVQFKRVVRFPVGLPFGFNPTRFVTGHVAVFQ